MGSLSFHVQYSSASVLLSLCIASIIAVSLICGHHFDRSVRISGAELYQYGPVSIPLVELRSKVIAASDDHLINSNANRSSHLHHHLHINELVNQTVLKKIPKPKASREQELEQGLARARASIRRAVRSPNRSSTFDDDVSFPGGSVVYRNPGAFYQSYLEMEKKFKVYVYTEGDPPMAHDGPCKDIYSIEGRFMHEMENGAAGRRFKTKSPKRAHVYFMPFSVTWMVKYLYKPFTYNLTPLRDFVADYAPHASAGNQFLYNTSIRVLCNANTSEGFNPQKDVSLPEIYLYGGNVPSKLISPPPPQTPRPYLGFFAGGLHGPIRPILLAHWKTRDEDLRVYEYLPEGEDYASMMLKSRFCLCPSGHEVASPRIVEAIYAECVPVILSEHYALPFSDVLRWEAFSVRVEVSEIWRLKEVLMAVPEEKYSLLVENLRVVRRHFELNQPAKRFDVFHMILHSVWLRRINLRLA
ncbi:hypothetical protein GBA52_000235 [Prunus armeniaca]|nr:hypothetical protein GBA52_000235 [Prunus armeniaca]